MRTMPSCAIRGLNCHSLTAARKSKLGNTATLTTRPPRAATDVNRERTTISAITWAHLSQLRARLRRKAHAYPRVRRSTPPSLCMHSTARSKAASMVHSARPPLGSRLRSRNTETKPASSPKTAASLTRARKYRNLWNVCTCRGAG
jgi:hypothetical protein